MTNDSFDPGPLARAELSSTDDRWTLVFVREFHHPPERVWVALTDPAELAAWAPFEADRNLEKPGQALLTMVDGDASEDLRAFVKRAEPPSLLEYTWGDDILRWELTPNGAGTTLTLRHTVKERDGVPKAAAGWHLCLVVAERLLDDDPIEPIRGEGARDFGWDDLHDAYAEQLAVGTTG